MSPLSCDEVRELAPGYVLDGLSPTEAAAVKEHLAAHAGAHPEVVELGQIAPALAYLTDPVAPPAGLKERVLAAAAMTAQEAPRQPGIALPGSPALAPAPVPPRATTSGQGVLPIAAELRPRRGFRARRGVIARWAFAAAAVLSIVVLVFANAVLQRDLSSARSFSDQLHRAVSLAAAPDSRVAVIGAAAAPGGPGASGAPAGPNGLAVIPASGPGILVMQGMSPTAGGSVYEAWAIVGSGAPVPVGSFSVGSDGFGWLAEVTLPHGGDLVVALTKEPGPGATKPTLPIVASGTAAPGH